MVQLKDPEKMRFLMEMLAEFLLLGWARHWRCDQRVEWRNEEWPPIPRINALVLESLGIRKDSTAKLLLIFRFDADRRGHQNQGRKIPTVLINVAIERCQGWGVHSEGAWGVASVVVCPGERRPIGSAQP